MNLPDRFSASLCNFTSHVSNICISLNIILSSKAPKVLIKLQVFFAFRSLEFEVPP